MDPINPVAAQPDASQLNAAEPAANAGNRVAPALTDALSLAELNQLTGRDFKSKESALKSIGDTFSFATTRVADITKVAESKVDENYKKLASDLAAAQKEIFYTQNPQYAPHRKLIENLGGNPLDVVNGDVFKDTFTKLSAHEQTVKLKTVLESNPRLASSRDSLSKAVDLKKSMNGFVTKDVEKLATDAVLDAYGLR